MTQLLGSFLYILIFIFLLNLVFEILVWLIVVAFNFFQSLWKFLPSLILLIYYHFQYFYFSSIFFFFFFVFLLYFFRLLIIFAMSRRSLICYVY